MKRSWILIVLVLQCLFPFTVYALDLDWSGQFRTESHWIYNYPLDIGGTTVNAARAGQGGYYIPGGGSKDAFFQTLFMRLRPSVIVNDNIFIKSEWWVGDPIIGFYGSGAPYTSDKRQYNSTFSRGSFITAQRIWGEFQSDLGTVQAGRMPLHWGLGVVWNSGNGVYDRYMSTGDGVRLLAKFGSFTVSPALIKYTMGNNVSSSCSDPTAVSSTGVCSSTQAGGSGVSDISLAFKYENPDENMELGVNFIRRLAGSAQGARTGLFGIEGNGSGTNQSTGMNFNTWDIYGKKTLGAFTFGAEVPITSGSVGTAQYKTTAVALEMDVKLSESWESNVRAGLAPGQPDIAATGSVDSYKAFFFHPNYRTGLIMFNYQLANFAGPNNSNDPNVSSSGPKSPFDNPIVNAKYVTVGGSYRADKWSFRTNWIFAKASEVANTSGRFFNYWERQFRNRNTSAPNQESALGWEMDFGTTYRWDEAFRFDLDCGWYFPGAFYRFSNTSAQNPASTLFATVFKVGVSF